MYCFYFIVFYGIVLCFMVLYCILCYFNVSSCIILYLLYYLVYLYTILFNIVLYCIVFYLLVFYFLIFCFLVFHCVVFHCIVFYCIPSSTVQARNYRRSSRTTTVLPPLISTPLPPILVSAIHVCMEARRGEVADDTLRKAFECCTGEFNKDNWLLVDCFDGNFRFYKLFYLFINMKSLVVYK